MVVSWKKYSVDSKRASTALMDYLEYKGYDVDRKRGVKPIINKGQLYFKVRCPNIKRRILYVSQKSMKSAIFDYLDYNKNYVTDRKRGITITRGDSKIIYSLYLHK